MFDVDVRFVVLLYGTHLTSRYKEYLDMVKDLGLKECILGRKISLELYGGFTNLNTNPGKSEALIALDEVFGAFAKLAQDGQVIFMLDDASITTNRNLINASQRPITARLHTVVFGCVSHSVHIWLAANLLLKGPLKFRFKQVTSETWLRHTLVKSLPKLLALFFPFFEKMELRRKEKVIKES